MEVIVINPKGALKFQKCGVRQKYCSSGVTKATGQRLQVEECSDPCYLRLSGGEKTTYYIRKTDVKKVEAVATAS